MAELNFGLLTPPGSQSIGNAFVTGMDQGQEARARDLQMQQSMRQGQMAELQYKKAQDAEAKLNQFYAHVADNGGPQDPIAIEDQMIRSGIPQVANTGLSARMTRLKVERDRKLYAAANAPAASVPTGGTANMLPGVVQTAPAEGTANMLPGVVQGAPVVPPRVRSQMDELNARIDANLALGTDQGNKTADLLQKQADNLSRRYTVGTTLMGAEGNIIGTAPEATSQEIRTMQALGYPPTQAGYAAFRDTQRQERLLTPEEEAQRVRIAGASRAPAQPRPDRLLTPEEEAQKIRIAQGSRPPPVETRPLTAQQQLKARETQVAQRGVVKSADTAATELETLADNLLGNPDKKIQPNPGLGGITGYMGLVPSFPKTAARSAQQQLDTFKGKVMAFGRLLATQQGKLGNMAVSEWKFISDAIEKIDPLANNFDTQLRDVVRQAKDFAAAKRETFDELYDSTTPTGGANAPQAPVDLQSAARAEIARRAKDTR
tara:strand:+ start:178 stop:1647 length:1470 start_codon:yes stop_codon:yes gene_type:complete